MEEGEAYEGLKPVIAIWLLTGGSFGNIEKHHLRFKILEEDHQVLLTEDLQIHVLQLHKWRKPSRLLLDDFWLYFFKEAKQWQRVPLPMQKVNWLEQAMKVLQGFSERQKEHLLYMSRVEARRQQISEQLEFEREHQLRLAAESKAEQAELEKQAAMQEVERLKALLAKQN